MTKHQNLTLQRYTRDAIRKLEAQVATSHPGEREGPAAALRSAEEILALLKLQNGS